MVFRDLKKQYEVNKTNIDKVVMNVFQDCAFINGQQVKVLEEMLAEYVGVKHCITCANGTDGLLLSLMAMGIRERDAVFVPDFTFFASAEVISFLGGHPVFVDVDDTFNMDVCALRSAINAVLEEGELIPRIIMAVDMFGQPADFLNIREIADEYSLTIIEDAAQGFGGRIREKRACSFGDISVTSFFPAKPLGCYGDGGAIFTNSDEWASLLSSLKVHGKGNDKYDNVRIGMNSRLDTLQAAILIEKFRIFTEYELEKANDCAKIYTELLYNKVKTPLLRESFSSSWAQYSILSENREQRDGIKAYLAERNVPTMIYYPIPMHAQSVYKNMGVRQYIPLNNATYLCERVLSLPMHPYLETNEIEKVCFLITEYIS